MEIQKLKDISTRIYSSIQALLPTDIQVIKDILELKTIKYGNIRTFSVENSQKIILLVLKQNCLILMKFLVENQIELPKMLLDSIISFLINKNNSSIETTNQTTTSTLQTSNISFAKNSFLKDVDIQAQIEIERITTQITNAIIDILYLSKYTNDELIDFLESKNVPDIESVNLAPLVNCEYKSFELKVLHELLIGPVLLSLIQSYKGSFRKIVKRQIIKEIKKKLDNADKTIIYEIFYLINDKSDLSLLKSRKIEHSPEFIAFVFSLIHDKEDAEVAYDKLKVFYEDLEYALKVLINTNSQDSKQIQPKDEQTIIYLLETITKLVKYKSIHFYKFLQNFQALLKLKINKKIKAHVYEILSYFINDKDVFIEKIIDCKEEVEHELKRKEYFLLPRLIKFLNVYNKREKIELDLLKHGKSLGSPYLCFSAEAGANNNFINASDHLYLIGDSSSSEKKGDSSFSDYKILGLRSEDPNTLIECLETPIASETLRLNANHIRNAMIKDIRAIEKVLEYQVEYKSVIEDISIINLLLCVPNARFFEYVSLFNDFTPYLNGDFLERICDSPQEGIDWLIKHFSRDVGEFLIKNCVYFNDLIKNQRKIQKLILLLYDKLLDENLEDVSIILFDEAFQNDVSTLFLYEDDDSCTDAFFNIFSKQLLYSKFVTGKNFENYVLKKKYSCLESLIYIKAKIVAGLEVSSDINNLKKNLVNIDDLLGYLKITSCSNYDYPKTITSSIYLNFGIKDTGYFCKTFAAASQLEKIILFFSLDKVDKEAECIIKDEVMKSLKCTNRLYLRICVLQLFKCRDLDNILKILEKDFEDRALLLKLSINNIIKGGKYCSKSLINFAEPDFLNKALFILYYNKIWDKEYITEFVSKMAIDYSDELKYLYDDIKKY